MLKVTYSQRLEALVAALAEDLLAARRAGELDPFDPITIAVPSRALAVWVEQRLADTLGVAGNLRFPFLDGLLAELAVAGRPGARVVDHALARVLIARALADPVLLARPALAPIRSYLDQPGDRDVVRLELADEVALLFAEYDLTRPAWLQAWRRDQPASGAPGGDEPWQRALWRAVFAAGGLVDRLAGGTMATALDLLLGRPARADELPARLYLFGFTHLAPRYLDALAHLGRAAPVHLLLPNPCREFWDDVGEDAADAPLLALWGRGHRELVRQVGERTGFDDDARFVEPPPPTTALAALQADVLVRASVVAARPRHHRPGVSVLRCPAIRRELEVIAREIWTRVERDPTLLLSDVAVLIAGDALATYQAHVAAVFHEHLELPHHVVDLPLASHSRVAEAVGLLLELPLGRLTRPELGGVLLHPAVVAGHPEAERDDWLRWIDRLGIVHGGDHDDHAGTYIDLDVFNWDQGVSRLALGAVMEGDRSGELRAVSIGSRRFLPEEVAASDLASAAALSGLVRRLVGLAHDARAEPRALTEWARFVDQVVADVICADGELDEQELARCRAAIGRLAELDLDGAAQPYAVAHALIRSELGALRGTRGDLLADGVVVAPLGQAPLPFRVVFVAGLGEGHFPARDPQGGLDLRLGGRRPGDRSPRDRDLSALLDAVLATRDELILSYVARDERTGDPLDPSSALLDLSQLVRGYVADGVELDTEHPLRRHDERYPHDLGSSDPLGARQARSLALRRDLDAHLAARGAGPGDEEGLRRALAASPDPALRALFGLPPAAEVGERAPPRELSIASLRGFLDDPVQAWARLVVGVAEADDDDGTGLADEPIERDALGVAGLLREVVAGFALAGGGGLARLLARYRERASREALGGHVPVGRLGAIQRQVDEAALAAVHAALVELGAAEGPCVAIGFGRCRAGTPLGERRPPLPLGEALPALVGALEPHGPGGSLVVVPGTIGARHLVRGALDLMVLCAAGAVDGAARMTVVSAREGAKQYRLVDLDRAEAQAYLAALARELVARPHDYLLPGKAAWDFLRKPGKKSLTELIEAELRSAERVPWRRGVIRRLERLAIPDDAEAIARRRLGPLVDRLEEVA